MATPIKKYTREEVKRHNCNDDLWLVMNNCVYDVTEFVFQHPGGEEVLFDRAGVDATDCFDSVGHSVEAKNLRETFKIGEITNEEQKSNHQSNFDGVYGRKFTSPKSPLFDYIVPILICLIVFAYFFVI